jgi:hypothetical protein
VIFVLVVLVRALFSLATRTRRTHWLAPQIRPDSRSFAPDGAAPRDLREDRRPHVASRARCKVAKRRKRAGSKSAERIKLVEAIVAELKEHGRGIAKDPDALMVRIVLKTGLSREEIVRAAGDVVPLFREITARLRELEGP